MLSPTAPVAPTRPGFTVPPAVRNVISPEAMQLDARGVFDRSPSAFGRAWARSYGRLRRALAAPGVTKLVLLVGPPGSGKSTYVARHHEPDAVYFDAVLATAASRKPLIRIAQEAGKPVEVVWLTTPLAECLARNAERPADRRAPVANLHAAAAALSAHPPQRSEGIARIVRA